LLKPAAIITAAIIAPGARTPFTLRAQGSDYVLAGILRRASISDTWETP